MASKRMFIIYLPVTWEGTLDTCHCRYPRYSPSGDPCGSDQSQLKHAAGDRSLKGIDLGFSPTHRQCSEAELDRVSTDVPEQKTNETRNRMP